MRARTLLRCAVTAAGLFLALAASPGCSQTGPFQPVAFDAKPWQPPAGWDPEPTCGVGYYIAITSCAGCTGISYALCDGIAFDQCVCGGAPWPGATCPQTFVCSRTDFPPENWMEFTDYAGPGWAGLQSHADAGASSGGAGTGVPDGG
jgi:hypothetical protein